MSTLGEILVEEPDAVFNAATDIKELIGDEQPGGGDAFALEAGEATLVYLLDWKKARSFLRWCLGFSYADTTDPWKLHRENPQLHPRFPWLTRGDGELFLGGTTSEPRQRRSCGCAQLPGRGVRIRGGRRGSGDYQAGLLPEVPWP